MNNVEDFQPTIVQLLGPKLTFDSSTHAPDDRVHPLHRAHAAAQGSRIIHGGARLHPQRIEQRKRLDDFGGWSTWSLAIDLARAPRPATTGSTTRRAKEERRRPRATLGAVALRLADSRRRLARPRPQGRSPPSREYRHRSVAAAWEWRACDVVQPRLCEVCVC